MNVKKSQTSLKLRTCQLECFIELPGNSSLVQQISQSYEHKSFNFIKMD